MWPESYPIVMLWDSSADVTLLQLVLQDTEEQCERVALRIDLMVTVLLEFGLIGVAEDGQGQGTLREKVTPSGCEFDHRCQGPPHQRS